MPTPSLILGIETSCDETAAAVVRDGWQVLSNTVASQHDLHAEYRGVVPEIASRAHAERILPIIRTAVAEAGVELRDVEAVAVGNRPGLIGSLLVGVAAAKALAWSLGVPIVGVDHVEAHLHAGSMAIGSSARPAPVVYPALGLVISGGHTAIYRCTGPTELTRIGSTIDDAVGEAYDKAAAILGLPFPGGPYLDKLAASSDPGTYTFPVSRLAPGSLDLSFSGLKTAVLYAVRGVPGDSERGPAATADHPKIASAFQQAAVGAKGAIMTKLRRALEANPDCRALLVGGGVSANSLLRTNLAAFAAQSRLDLRLPAMELCVDNGAMIAGLAWEILRQRQGVGDDLEMTASPSGRR